MRPVRVAVLNSHPIQYFAPLYAYLNRAEDIEVTALYCSDFSLRGGHDPGFQREVTWDIDLLAGYRAVFLGKRARVRNVGGFFSLIVPEVWREIRSGRYDVLWLHGHRHAVNLIAFAAAKTMGMPVMMRAETHLDLQRGRLKQALRRSLLGAFYRRIDRFLAIGSRNHAFYRSMDVPEEKIFRVPYSVDNDRFSATADAARPERGRLLRELGLPDDRPVVLYASRLVARKHPDDVLRAAAALQAKHLRFSLLFVGTGEYETRLRQLAAELDLRDFAFAGFVNQAQLPRVYAAADVFVLPAENEPWGLVVNEVMCAGLPVVASNEVGSVHDLVADGENGYTHAPGDVDALTAALERLLRDAGLRSRMGEASRTRISRWGFEQCLEGMRAALRGVATQ